MTMKWFLALTVPLGGLPLWAQCWEQTPQVGQFAPAPQMVYRPMTSQPEVWHWTEHPTGTALFRNGVQVGWWDYGKGQYRSYDAVTRSWGAWLKSAPIDPPAKSTKLPKDAPAKPVVTENFGIDLGKLRDCPKPVYRLDGREVGRDVAEQALQDSLPQDQELDRLTLFGPKEERERIRRALESSAELSEFRDKLVVQDYPADHWVVKQRGFVTEPGQVTFYYQQPDGTVLDRWSGFEGAGKLRDRLRNRGKAVLPKLLPFLGLGVPWSVWVVGGMAVAGWVLTRAKGVSHG